MQTVDELGRLREEVKRLNGEAAVLRGWIKGALEPLEVYESLFDCLGALALLEAGRKLVGVEHNEVPA